jgi:hypothetical protein
MSASAAKISQQVISAPDDSEIATTTDASGVETKTRTFKSHLRVSKVVVTTSNGQQTAKVYSHSNVERDLPAERIPTALEADGDSLADAVGFVVPIDKQAKPDAQTQVASRTSRPQVKTSSQNAVTTKTIGKSIEPEAQTNAAPNQNAGTPSLQDKLPQNTSDSKKRGIDTKTSETQKRGTGY